VQTANPKFSRYSFITFCRWKSWRYGRVLGIVLPLCDVLY